jgi:hypothetical protein
MLRSGASVISAWRLSALWLLLLSTACTAPNPEYLGGRPPPFGQAPDGGGGRDAPAADGAAGDRPEALTEGDAGPSDGGDPEVAPEPPLPRLVGYWRLDEEPGDTEVVDSSGQGNHGTLESMDETQAWVAGRLGNALQLTASADSEAGVMVPPSAAVAGIRQFTIAAWIFRTAMLISNTSVVSRQLGTASTDIYSLSTINDELVIYAGTDVTPAPKVRIAGAAPLDQWIHVAATFDGASLRLYQNGVEIGSSPLTRPLPTASNPLYIGTNKNPTRNDLFIGLIDDVALFSVALSPGGIGALFRGDDPGTL